MRDKGNSKSIFVGGVLILLGGCQNLGPSAIDQGRDRYNNIIQSTSKEQAFSNIIRVHYHEPTSFMDVTEVDAATTFTGAVNGGLSSIGAIPGYKSTSAGTISGQLGNVAGGVTYTESPLIRYQPLLGQALVAQLATPVSPDVIWSLYDSGWSVSPLFDFAAAFLTLNPDDYFAAVNTIAELDQDGRLQLVAEKSELTKAKDEMASGKLSPDKNGSVVLQVTNKAASTGTSDALVLYLLRYPHSRLEDPAQNQRDEVLWRLLLKLYDHTQPLECLASNPPAERTGSAKEAAARAAARAAAAAKIATDAATAAAKAADDAKLAAAAAAAGAAPGAQLPEAAGPAAPASGTPNPPECKPVLGSIHLRDSIELRTMPVTVGNRIQWWTIGGIPKRFDISAAPLMRTNSALGILTTATGQPSPKIAFVGPDEYLAIRSHPWNDPKHKDPDLSYYTLRPDEEPSSDEGLVSLPPKSELDASNRRAMQWLNDTATNNASHRVYLPDNPFRYFDQFIQVNRRLGHLRRYILIIKSATPPPADAYVTHFDHEQWYYIAGDDTISQKNFHLVSLFMTMMAIPSSTPPLAPTISVGGGM